jgi:hypothetical protein
MENEPVALHIVLLLLIVILTIVASLPLSMTSSWPNLRWLPLLSVPLYLFYETTMPVEANIRIDWFLIFPMLYICVRSSVQEYSRQSKGRDQT